MENQNILDDFVAKDSNSHGRRTLLPVWIKIFVWIFIVLGAFTIPVFIVGMIMHNFLISIYGLSAHYPDSFLGVSLTLIFVLKGFVGYALWTQKDWAISLALFDATLGILICLVVMMGLPFYEKEAGFTFRLELLALVPYLLKLIRIKPDWVRMRPL